MSTVLGFLFNSHLVALLLAPLVTLLVDLAKRGSAILDASPSWAKQLAAFVVGLALVYLAHFLPGVVPDACGNVSAAGLSSDCLAGLTSKDFFTAVLTGLFAILVKHGQQHDQQH